MDCSLAGGVAADAEPLGATEPGKLGLGPVLFQVGGGVGDTLVLWLDDRSSVLEVADDRCVHQPCFWTSVPLCVDNNAIVTQLEHAGSMHPYRSWTAWAIHRLSICLPELRLTGLWSTPYTSSFQLRGLVLSQLL